VNTYLQAELAKH